MAAARMEGTHRFYLQKPDGTRRKILDMRSELIGASGQSAVPSEQVTLPMSGDFLQGGGKIVWTFEADAAATYDTTDCIIRVPVVISSL